MKDRNFQIKNNLYLIIPIICLLYWAFHWLIVTQFNPHVSHFDFGIYYYSGRQILIDPNRFYKEDFGYSIGIAYLPFFQCLWAISLSLLPYEISYFIWYGINYICAIWLILGFNKILILMGVKEKIHRFLFLIVISNGWLILHQFALNQSKFMVGAILFFILSREIQLKRNKGKEKDFKYKFITYFLFCLIAGMVPYFFFLLLIYMFYDIPRDEMFNKKNLKTYGMVIIIFLAQNFLFFIFPGLLFDFFKIYRRFQGRQLELNHYYLIFLDELFDFNDLAELIISLVMLIVLYIFIIFLIITKKFSLELKFSYFAISFIFLNYLAYRILIIFLPLTLLFVVPFLNQDAKGIDFIKKNRIIVILLISVLGIYLICDQVNPYYPSFKGMSAGWLIFTIILGFCLLFLYLKRKDFIVENGNK